MRKSSEGSLSKRRMRSVPPAVHVWDNVAGSFTGETVLAAPSNSSSGAALAAHVTVTDVDGDGVRDLLTFPGASTFGDNDRALVYRGLPGGGFEPHRPYLSRATTVLADLDADGDPDAFGAATLLNRRFGGPADGLVRQYGPGVAGTGGVVPVLGASGPLRVGSTTASLRVRRSVGGTLLFLAIGSGEALLVDQPIPGHTTLVDGLLALVSIGVPGVPGLAGGGAKTIPVAVDAGLAGLHLFHQGFLVDGAAPGLLSATNGLELLYGL